MPTRRAHKKSRLGCVECKRRKIKCDEVHPICWNCTRYGVLCSFDPANRARPAALGLDGVSPGSIATTPTPRAIDSPHNSTAWPDLLASATSSRSATRIVPPPDQYAQPEHNGSNPDSLGVAGPSIRDLELMHHYSVCTSESLALREDRRYVWRVIFPQEGYRHPFVMHGLLSLAALHKAYLFPSRRQEFLNLGASHHALGLERFRALLSDIGDDNWRAMVCYASIVVVHVCSLAARSENGCIAEPVRSTWEFFSVVRGFRTTLAEFTPRIGRTSMAPLVWSIFPPDEKDEMLQSKINLSHSALPPDTFSALSLIRSFYEGEDSLPNREDYVKAISTMEYTSKIMVSQGPDIEVGLVIWWAYDIPQSVMNDIRQFKPHALLLLAYFCVSLAITDKRYWFLQGWAKQLLDDVDRRLRSKEHFRQWLEWPRNNTR